MISVIRRLWLFMGVSALLNIAAFALLGRFWRPLPSLTPPTPLKLVLLTLLPPAPLVKRLPPKPRPMPLVRPRPKMSATPLPPAPHRLPKIAPVVARSAGGRPKPRPKPKPAPRWHLLAQAAPQAEVRPATRTADVDDEGTTPDEPMPPTQPAPTVSQTSDVDGTEPQGSDTAGSGRSGSGQDIGTGSGQKAGTDTGPFGIRGNGGGGSGPRHVVYVLDISGSMNMRVDKWHGETRIERARRELTAQLQSLTDGETFSLIAFSDSVRRFRPELISAGAKAVGDAERFLAGLKPDGDTDLEGALTAALSMPGINVIYVITDGVPRTPDHEYSTRQDFDALAARIRAADTAHARIFTVGLLGPNPDGSDESVAASALLTQIAGDSGGAFKAVALDKDEP